MTATGTPATMFARALERRALGPALMHAREMGGLSLFDAAELLALVAERDPERFEAYAARWISRLCRECPDVTLAELAAAIAAIARLPIEQARAIAVLHDVCRARGARGLQGRHMRLRPPGGRDQR